MKKWISLFLCAALMLSLCSLSAAAASEEQVDETIDGIIAWSLEKSGAADEQEWLDTALSEGAGKGTEWYVFALLELGKELDYSHFAAALQSYVDNNNVSNATTRERIALAFLATGYHSPCIEEFSHNSIGELGLMSYVFGLHLSNNAVECSMSAEEIISAILEFELEDGGWAITGEKGDPDATAMVLQSLAPHRGEESVDAAIEKGLAFLSENQLDNGGYRSFGQECPESVCQVLLTLCTLGIDPLSEDYVKNGNTIFDAIYSYRLEDGSFCHSAGGDSNNLATVETFYALASYKSYLSGGKNLYEFEYPTVELSEALAQSEEAEEAEPAVEESAEPETAEPEAIEEQSTPSKKKIILLALCAVAALGACAYFYFSGKRSGKNFIFVILVFALAVYMVFSVRIEKTEDYYGETAAGGHTITTTITISCETVKGEKDYIPADGMVLPATEVEVSEGDTAFDQLVQVCKNYTIHMDKEESAFGSAYVKGLANIYEFDFGELSGWMYSVNGEFADVGAGEYVLQDGDCVEWVYTKELGKDVGDDSFSS